MTLIVTVATGLTLLQDSGRKGLEHLGVPAAGPWHHDRYRQLAHLLDQPAPTVLEIIHGTVHLTATEPTLIAATGPATLRSNTMTVTTGMTYLLDEADTLIITHVGPGPAYVSAHGLSTAHILGSASTDTLSQLGPAPVTAGLYLPITPTRHNPGRFINRPERQDSLLRYIPGPHVGHDVAGTWTVRSSARTGTRLTSSRTFNTSNGTLPSLPTLPGTIQLPPDGQPIILGPDSGVTGGYRVAGVIISTDLPRLACLQAGQNISLVPVSVDTATALHDTASATIRRSVTSIDRLL